MKIIGLTGGIGSGKSTVAAILKELGATIIDLDKVGHQVLNPGTAGWRETVQAFGQQILSPYGTVDRQKLAQIVFDNPEALQTLNRITHPKIDDEVQSRIRKFEAQGTDVVVIEAALINAVSWASQAAQIWVIKSAKETTLNRLKERGMNEAESLARMGAQSPAEEYIKQGLIIISNDGTIEELKSKVVKMWKQLHNEDRG
jgi:dephospho-CoA kinase